MWVWFRAAGPLLLAAASCSSAKPSADAGSDASPDSPSLTQFSGIVDVYQRTQAMAPIWEASATFSKTLETTAEGPCVIGTRGTPPYLRAGTVTITAAMMVSMMPRSDATYHDMGNDVWWMNVGDKIGVNIMGDPAGAPAFEGAVTAPSAVTIQTKIQGASISRNAPFTVMWTPGTGTTQFFFEYSTRLVTCEFPAEVGTGTVPVSALLYLSGPNAGLSIYVIERTRLQKPDWTLDVIARTPALIMGEPAYGDLTFQ